MGQVYWENELIEKNTGKKTIYFFENLRIFVENHPEIKFYNVFAKKSSGNVVYLEATDENKTIIYRQVEGIESKDDLIEWRQILSYGRKRKYSYYNIKYNLPKLAYGWLKNKMTKNRTFKRVVNGKIELYEKPYCYITPPYRELCSDNEDLYKGFSSSYFNGYMFNSAGTNKIYRDVYNFDFKNNHSSIMYYQMFPKNFTEVNPSNFSSICNKKHFYGKFKIAVKNEDPYLFKMNGAYNTTSKILEGYFNDVDFKFLTLLCGIDSVYCSKLWEVELGELDPCLKWTIKQVYIWTQNQEKGSKKRMLLKWCNEKLYGEAAKRRFYPTSYVWDNNTQKLKEVQNPYNWETIKKNLTYHYDYSIAVWTCSYARLRLIKLRRKLEQIGCEVLYGDIDSIKFRGEQGLKIVEELNNGIEKDFTLGKLELEDFAKEFKVLDFKWYCYTTEDNFVVKAAGANIETIRKWLEKEENPVKAFTKDFPEGVNPYKRIRKINNTYKVCWVGSTIQDNTLTEEKNVIISCAGSGKTTTLIERVKEKRKACPDDKVVVIAFTNKNVEELRERIGLKENGKFEIRTLDSLAASYLDGVISGLEFERKLEAATELLLSHPNLFKPCHLFVDEFQDLDQLKFNFICSIPCISRFYIGDPNQSIYGYSGAINLFNRLKDFKVEKRSINYRCGQLINDYGEGFLLKENRPNAVSKVECAGTIEKRQLNEIENVECVVLCRTNEQVKRVKELYPTKQVLTIHKAKGLSFDCVAVLGIENLKETVEEQNIAYVGATRARYHLIILKED